MPASPNFRVVLLALALLAAGCGQKGPLYLPGSPDDPAGQSAPSGNSQSTAPTGSEPAPEPEAR